jgi:hypothetical protein
MMLIPTQFETFRLNNPNTWADPLLIEQVDPESVRRKLGLKRSELSVITDGRRVRDFQ